MSYVKGLMPKAKVPDFCKHLEKYDFIVIDGKSQYEMAQVMLDNRFHAITVDSKGVIGIPKMLEFQAKLFLEAKAPEPEVGDITDSQRLDFMLDKSRKLIYEVVGYNGRGTSFIDVYVEQGFMSDRRFDAVRIEVQSLSEDCTPEHKRQAIDLAIKEFNSDDSTEKTAD